MRGSVWAGQSGAGQGWAGNGVWGAIEKRQGCHDLVEALHPQLAELVISYIPRHLFAFSFNLIYKQRLIHKNKNNQKVLTQSNFSSTHKFKQRVYTQSSIDGLGFKNSTHYVVQNITDFWTDFLKNWKDFQTVFLAELLTDFSKDFLTDILLQKFQIFFTGKILHF